MAEAGNQQKIQGFSDPRNAKVEDTIPFHVRLEGGGAFFKSFIFWDRQGIFRGRLLMAWRTSS